ncbi:glucose-1-phosphate thymidylyltransferase [Deinococcus sp. HMF7604]|uniref:glucose-1-phosphate thymidylyltransferase n=1 Tax=Deinococcus betulae TaxID=2873312 RepID=UPI001CCB1E4D|nr:glucose-1-phosphate thymidylyltransferase [Deinococcus betulae]
MKALIPAAGFGTRLRPLTYSRPKPVLSVAGRPVIAYALDHLQAAGITDIAVVVSPSTAGPLRAALADWPDVTYLCQDRMGGLGHAVLTAEDWVGGQDLCVLLADNLFEDGPAALIQGFQRLQVDAAVALCEVEQPSAFGVATVQDELVTSIVEKPIHPPSHLAVAGSYCFRPSIFEALRTVPVSARGELELTDAIAQLVTAGRVYGHRQRGWWKDTGRPEDLLAANRWMLAQRPAALGGTMTDSEVFGAVTIEPGAQVRRAVITGPVFIGADAIIEDAQIGPFVSVGPGAKVQGANIQDTILEAGAVVTNLRGPLMGSILGQGAQLTGAADQPFHQCLLPDASTLCVASH